MRLRSGTSALVLLASSCGAQPTAKPVATHHNPWVPLNGPSISDLMDLFDF